ncbi:hypothetical protein [Mesorhizobium sp.]|uniref:hypothetical protein n=1 Tax=Mesorhizobium sp. TaxID=1871066 RepID=UPI0025E35655|nr:hypothetical protein [Mesorhizobium sp.]
MFSTLQDRLPKELALAGIVDIEAANRFIAQTYLPAHNARFARPAAVQDSAFVAADPAVLAEILCIQEERVVARDNTVAFARLRLQLPQSPIRPLRQSHGQGQAIPGWYARNLPRAQTHCDISSQGATIQQTCPTGQAA